MLTPLLLSLGVLSAPVTFTLRIPDGRTRFHTGEVIPIELACTSTIPDRFVLDTATSSTETTRPSRSRNISWSRSLNWK